MYALFLCATYEGSDLLGLYSSLERAVEAAGTYQQERRVLQGEWLEIQELAVDAPSFYAFDREAVWTS